MIRIFTRGTYIHNTKKGFYYVYCFSNDRTRPAYTESKPYECGSAFEAECEGVFRGLDWAGKNQLLIEPIEVYCSPSVALCLGPQTAKYFRPKNEAAERAIGPIRQMTRGMLDMKVSYYGRPSQDDSDPLTVKQVEQGLH